MKESQKNPVINAKPKYKQKAHWLMSYYLPCVFLAWARGKRTQFCKYEVLNKDSIRLALSKEPQLSRVVSRQCKPSVSHDLRHSYLGI